MASPVQTVKTLMNDPASIRTSSQAKQLHAQIIKLKGRGVPLVEFATVILSIYSNFNLLQDSFSIFNGLRSPPTKAWKSVIKCCAATGHFVESLTLLKKMMVLGKNPGRNVFPSVLKTCAHLRNLKFGEAVHGCIVRFGLDSDLFTGNALMNMYAKLESLDGKHVFDRVSETNRTYRFEKVVKTLRNSHGFIQDSESCSAGGVENGWSDHTIDDRSCEPGQEFGRLVFDVDQIKYLDSSVRKQLYPCVGKTQILDGLKERNPGIFAQDSVAKVFEMMPVRDLVSWNTVLGGYIQKEMYEEALMTVREMALGDLKPDSFTLSSVLSIFADRQDSLKGKEIHGYAIRHGFDKDVFIGSGLADMYASSALMEDSYRIFRLLPQKDKVSWNTMIAACVDNGWFDKGLELLREMLMANIKPVAFTFSSIVPMCSHLTMLHLGKQLHGYIVRLGFDDNIYVASSLVHMYSKCGNIRIAQWIFDKMEFHDAISWTSMIMAHAVHGHAQDAILLFEKMEIEGVTPNPRSFLAVLTACSHAGLVDESLKYFKSMTQNHAISPSLEHYAAIADLLGRTGRLDEAYEFISSMHVAPTSSIWSTLLSACRVRKNIELAERVAKEMFIIDPKDSTPYLLLSHVYVSAGRWKDAMKLRTKMRKKGMKKMPACSWIEVDKSMHFFVSGNGNHSTNKEMSMALHDLMEQTELRHVPDTCL
ncbi:pentatricopeptide repeat-containing protein-like [Dorcoceras hygrometricum]|uniref:Pentatricopeptide repeat-containing protein-like n=1 Tax=Dorcoceras hygrometricum TaxID=472368 RepID=A0A2Z7CQ99_9LAMI|nr:pentatricopeptide repeat-containing protein-like [Dorcoceras hygrometricum]